MSSLSALVADLAAGRVTVVDLTQPLGPDTPVIGLPDIFAPSPGVSIDVISRYDGKGPGWYWNTIRMGEHTGTHFDAPVHWITGRDLPNNTTDTIPAGSFIGPACVIDITAEVDANEDYLLDVAGLERWEALHGRVPRGAWVLLRTGWSRRSNAASFLNVPSSFASFPHGMLFAPGMCPPRWHVSGSPGGARISPVNSAGLLTSTSAALLFCTADVTSERNARSESSCSLAL